MQAAVVGVPGTGKTYFMVHYLKKYFTYDAFFREYHIKSNILILTNIAGLKFFGSSCINIESPEFLGDKKNGVVGKITREDFFTIPYMEKLAITTGKPNIILVVDEIQDDQYFPLGYKDAAVLRLFSYHRHIGMDIILGTQDAALCSRAVIAQCEYLAHGRLRSRKIVGSMNYKFTDNKGNLLYGKSLRTDKDVFAAYCSASTDEVNKPKNALTHWAIITFVFLLLAGGLFKSAMVIVSNKAKPENARKNISPSAAALQPAAPVVPIALINSAAVPVPVPVPPVPAVPVVASLPPVPAYISQDINAVRVIGCVDSTGGKSFRYLLSDGQMISTSRKMNINQIYTNKEVPDRRRR